MTLGTKHEAQGTGHKAQGTRDFDWQQIDLYRFFAFVFGFPSAERFPWFHEPASQAALVRLWRELGCPGESLDGAPFRDYQQYEAIYIAVFDVGAPAPPVPLLESAYEKAVPAQQTALENVSFYDVLGLRADTSRYAPDHLVTQLEFLSAVRYARENSPDDAQRENLARLERDFLERHLLNWLPAAHKKLDREQVPVFPALLALLLAFLHRQV